MEPTESLDRGLAMKEFDDIIKTLIASALVGLAVCTFNINADVKVNSIEISHLKETQKDSIQVSRELTKAVTDLRIVIEKIRD